MDRGMLKAGHTPTLLMAFLYFDVSFMAWVLLGPLANSIAPELGLDADRKYLLTAIPILGGSLMRLVLGVLADRIGPRRTATLGMALTAVPLLLGWLWAETYPQLLLVGALLGVAGASFAVALPLASRWYPPQYQGLAMGIAGAGNSGTALSTLFAPMLAKHYGWHAAFGIALIPLALTMIAFRIFAKDAPTQPPPKPIKEYGCLLNNADTWWFCFFYFITFGGFVGLASALSGFFNDQFKLDPIVAGYFTTACVFAGSFFRPIGGHLADRVGGVKLLAALFLGIGVLLTATATLPPLWTTATLLFCVMALMGMGNGAVFQLVPQRFAKEIGVATGVVGAAGGVGGFFLPTLLGYVKKYTGGFGPGFFAFGLLAFGAVGLLLMAARQWTWITDGGRAIGVRTAQPAFATVLVRDYPGTMA
jgi:MFS transporter, NNP family, nitrate/nitrite transporter